MSFLFLSPVRIVTTIHTACLSPEENPIENVFVRIKTFLSLVVKKNMLQVDSRSLLVFMAVE